LLCGHQIDAAESFRIGLVDRVVDRAELMPAAVALAHELASKAPVAARAILEAVHKGLQMPFAEAQAYEATLFGLVATTEDMQEGTRAFLEKRKPAFTGR
jgi:enoyl-CoA hydratase